MEDEKPCRYKEALLRCPYNGVRTRNGKVEASLRDPSGQASVTLTGEVRCYYHKQMAQEVVRGVDTSITIFNLLEVVELA